MPLVKISIRTGKSPGYQRALLDGVHAALVEAFLIPDADRHQQLFELDEDCFEIPAGKSSQFVLVEIIAFQGRSLEAKRNLYAAIVRNFGRSPGISGDDVMIILHEPPKENWGIRGGRPASEVDIGFKVDV
jgi:phenylpyruvate tautomerase PptA (4-oxalocrotonate tautomerase family)